MAGMVVLEKDFNLAREQVYTPDRIEIDNIPGMGAVVVRWIVKGNSQYSIEVNSPKGGVLNK
jgi:hypothetical protein